MSISPNTVRLPAGVRDFLPRAAARRRAIADALLGVFERWGYERIITPVVEVADVLDLGLGDSARASAVRFVEPMTGEVVALRPDITPQIARIAATRMTPGSLPTRLCYEGPVTRLNPRAGGQREMLQAGIELVDAPSPEGDAEALAVAAAALAATRLLEVRLDLGHVAFSRFALECCGDERRHDLEAALLRKDRNGVAAIAASLPRSVRAVVTALPTLFGAREDVLARARALTLPAGLRRAIAELEAVLELCAVQMPADVHRRISLDLGEVRGFDYYTGLRFRGFADGVGQAVLRGGRYDELVGRYGRDAAATGFAIDIESIAEAQDVRGIAAPRRARGLAIIVVEGKRRDANVVAAQLRARGHRVLVQVVAAAKAPLMAAQASDAGWSHVLRGDRGWTGSAGSELIERGAAVKAAIRGNPSVLERWLSTGE